MSLGFIEHVELILYLQFPTAGERKLVTIMIPHKLEIIMRLDSGES
jgi:hypothetical protein